MSAGKSATGVAVIGLAGRQFVRQNRPRGCGLINAILYPKPESVDAMYSRVNDLLTILQTGYRSWNTWRDNNPTEIIDFTRVKLGGINLDNINLKNARLYRANLENASFFNADLTGAYLSEARLRGANLRQTRLTNVTADGTDFSRTVCWKANFDNSNLHLADFWGGDLSDASLRNASLVEARLHGAILIRADLTGANLSKSMIYGSSSWDLIIENTIQKDLVITPDAGRQKWHGYSRMETSHPVITVDDIAVAQFIYLLLNNERIRDVIDTITSKVVLILGRFTPERKAVLDALREELRKSDYLPVLFDFEKPAQRNFTETVSLLARMARFVVADMTDAKSIPQELGVIVPDLPSVPVQPLLLEGSGEYSMFEHFRRYPWVLPMYVYASPEQLITEIRERVIGPAEARARELSVAPH